MQCIKNGFIIFLVFSTFQLQAQTNNFRLDTLVDQYRVQIKVYENKLDEDNIKAYFSFYDSVQNGKLHFIYYFKFLPSVKNETEKSFVPILQDWDNRDNSCYIWKDIMHGEFAYDQVKNYVFDQFKKKNKVEYDSSLGNANDCKIAAKNQYLTAFNGLINKEYRSFVQTLHPATLKMESYAAKAAYFEQVNKNADFHFTNTRVDKVSEPVNFFGEIQLLLYTTSSYQVKDTKGELKAIIVSRSFNKGENWYGVELNQREFNNYYGMSKGNLREPAISWDLIKSVKF